MQTFKTFGAPLCGELLSGLCVALYFCALCFLEMGAYMFSLKIKFTTKNTN